MEFKNREEYLAKWKYKWEDNCPFCADDFHITNKIIYTTDYWIIFYNKYPYFSDDINLLVCPKKHREFTSELTKEEFWDYLEVEKFMKTFYEWNEYFSFIRQTWWNKSIEHLHYHYLTWMPSSRIIDWENFLKIKK